MKTKSLLIFACGILTASLCAAADAVKTIAIEANDNLRFSVAKIEASPGETLHVQLHNVGKLPKEVMGHNWILLVAGENPDTYAAAAASQKMQNYAPAALKDKVLAAIPLLGPGETGDTTFTAPTVPGKYSFLCSFPAHCAAGMRGVLIVK